MLVLRVFLYIVCVLSLTWGALVLGGPTALKSLIRSYTNSQLIASNVTITPQLNIKIGRLDLAIKGDGDQTYHKGFSRSIRLAWSIFGDKPFVEVDMGPTFVENFFSAENISISTTSFTEIDFQKIFLNAQIDNFKSGSVDSMEHLTLEAFYLRHENLITELYASTPRLSLKGQDNWVLNEIILKMNKINFTQRVEEQSMSVNFSSTEVKNIQETVNFQKLDAVFSLSSGNINFQLTTDSLAMLRLGRVSGRISADGQYTLNGLLENARVEVTNIHSSDEALDKHRVIVDIANLGEDIYQILAVGKLSPFELNIYENYVGKIPESNFDISLHISGVNEINGTFFYRIKNFETAKISGNGNLSVTINNSASFSDCMRLKCDLLKFLFDYELEFDQERIKGISVCYQPLCTHSSLSHELRTSNTAQIFKIINESQIINPLYSFYLYSFINSGAKLENGHQIKIN